MTGKTVPPAAAPEQLAFDDGKSPDALRTIGEVTRALGIRQHVLRYWEEQFPMLQPIKRSGNRRYYRREDVALIAEIDRLVHREGFTLRGARLALEARLAGGGGITGVASAPTPVPTSEREEQARSDVPSSFKAELEAIRADLASALALS